MPIVARHSEDARRNSACRMRIGSGVLSWSRFTGPFSLQRLWPGYPGQAWCPRMTLVTACFAACELWVMAPCAARRTSRNETGGIVDATVFAASPLARFARRFLDSHARRLYGGCVCVDSVRW